MTAPTAEVFIFKLGIIQIKLSFINNNNMDTDLQTKLTDIQAKTQGAKGKLVVDSLGLPVGYQGDFKKE